MKRISKISIITALIILSTTTLCGCTTLEEYDAKVQQQVDKNVEIQSLRLDISKIKAIVDELKSATAEEIQLYHLPRL